MYKRSIPLVVGAVFAFAAAACGGHTDGASGANLDIAASAADPPGSIRVDGTLFVPITSDWKAPTPSSKPFSEQSLDELAEEFRPIRVHVDATGIWRYRAAEPNYTVANAIKNGTTLEAKRSSSSLPPDPGSGVKPEYFFDPGNAGNPEVADPSNAPNPTSFPMNAIVYIDGLNGNCTGEYVAAHTMFTAAHCLSFNQVDNTFFMTFTPAATGYNGQVQSAPYGIYPNYSEGGCFSSTYPAAWDSNNCPSSSGSDTNTCEPYDFGAVDFRECGNPTIVSWFGVAENWSFGSGSVTNMYGYPGSYSITGSPPDPVGGSTYPGCGTNTNPQGHYPFLCGTSVEGGTSVNSTALESDSNVDSPGFSGGPWWVVGNDIYVTGINDGETSYFDFFRCGFNNCYRNFARYIDTSVWNYMTTNTEL